MKQRIKDKAQFDFIRYANVWEDAAVLMAGLDPQPGCRLLSIASAGDNTFSLLTANPELVVAVDINPVQLYLTEFKKCAIQSFDYQETLRFLGFKPSMDRWEMYQTFRSKLSENAQLYFDFHKTEWVELGIIHVGKFEKYFQLFSKRILPLIHSKKTIQKLLEPKSAAAQAEFFQNHWNTWRWRALFKVFFSSTVMGKLGRDPAFFEEVKIHVASYLLNRSAEHLSDVGAQKNPFLTYILTGGFQSTLPHYLQENHFNTIKNQLHKIQLFEGYAEDAINQYGPFDGMNLSNIFEYMDSDLFVTTAKTITAGMKSKGRIAYWNLMVPRQIGKICDSVSEQSDLMKQLSRIDNGFFYNKVVVDETI